jgi:hypothetical protein
MQARNGKQNKKKNCGEKIADHAALFFWVFDSIYLTLLVRLITQNILTT